MSKLPDADGILIADGLRKSYAGQLVVNDVSLRVHAAEVVGILGPNGAGKSTVVSMCYGAVRPDAGTVTICNHNVQTDGRKARRFLGVVPQEGDLDRDFSITDNIMVFCGLHGLSKRESKRRTEQLLSDFGLESHARKVPEALSGGLRQRAALVRALVAEPLLLFLDEPTTGLDPDARQDFWRLVTRLRAEGRGVLLTTHYMDEAERLCDRVLLMQQGQIVKEGSPQALIGDIVGVEVCEVEGLSEERLSELFHQLPGVSIRKYGVGFTVSGNDSEQITEVLLKAHPKRITRRRANLEDVFLTLTGEGLS